MIHARSRAPAWSALLAARRTGAHFVTTYHGTYNENFPGKRRYNAVMAQGERVIAISSFIAGHIRERHGTEPARIRVIPRGVDPGCSTRPWSRPAGWRRCARPGACHRAAPSSCCRAG